MLSKSGVARPAALGPRPKLKNAYWLLRHGRSLANEAGIIVSKKENGVKPEYGLAPLGKEQAHNAGLLLKEQLSQMPEDQAKRPFQIVASPFYRTIQTATLAGAQIGIKPDTPQFRLADELMERSFGSGNEFQPYADLYSDTWVEDAKDVNSIPGGDGESCVDVTRRLWKLFGELEAEYQSTNLLLVAHGDTLSICMAGFASLHEDGGENWTMPDHRAFQFETAELKRLI